MKYFILSLLLTTYINTFSQVKVTEGNNSSPFALSKQPSFTSFDTETADYFVITRTESFEVINTLIISDKSGHISTANDIRFNMGLSNNSFDVNNLLVVGGKPMLFVENHVKDGGKNILGAYTIDNGKVNPKAINIGSIDFTKMSNPGHWYVALSPDKKHVSVLNIAAGEKNAIPQFQYFILDENLKEVSKGQFSFPDNNKRISINNFLTSNKGDLFIVSEEYDGYYKMPVLYKYSSGGQPTIIPVMIANPDFKNLSYTTKISPSGDLIIAGYFLKNQKISYGDPMALGSYLFNSAKPTEVKTFNFDKPITNLTARNIVYNDNTFFLVGEQYQAVRQKNTSSPLSPGGMIDLFDYTHQDIMITGYSDDFSKKFDVVLNRKLTAHEFDQDLMIASGVVNNKLTLIYNDEYGKYIDDKYRAHNKLPVAVSITNDGLMESPINFAEELNVKVSTYKLYPQFFSNNNGHLVLLSGNSQSVKTTTFQ